MSLFFTVNALSERDGVAAPKQTPVKITKLKELSKVYDAAKSVQIKVHKEVNYALLGNKKNFDGRLVLKNKNLRLELQGDSDSLIQVKDGQVCVTTYPPKGTKLPTQVLRTTFEKKGKAQALLTAFLGGGDIEKQFAIKKREEKGQQVWFLLQPKAEFNEFTKVVLKVSSDKPRVEEIVYWDQIENKTTYRMKETQFDQKFDDKSFICQPPKDAEVSTM